MNKKIAHFFRAHRAHQRAVMADGGGAVTTIILPDGTRFERHHNFASAPIGEHALSAFQAAKRHIAWRAQFEADMKATRKRQKAAKKGWKTRRATA